MNTYTDERGFIKNNLNTNGIATITFYHPSHNSFPSKQLEELASILIETGKDKNVKVIVLKSDGERTFCSGASFDELLSIETREAGMKFFSGFAHVINAIRLNEKIIIGQVQGKAIGGGVGLAAACDYCFATEYASVRLSELGVNMGPIVIAPAVQRKIGLSAFTELVFNPEKYKDAHWAKSVGLYQEVYPDLPAMETAVQAFTNRLGTYNIEALNALKLILWKNTEHWNELLYERADISGKLVLSEETKAGLQAFKNKK